MSQDKDSNLKKKQKIVSRSAPKTQASAARSASDNSENSGQTKKQPLRKMDDAKAAALARDSAHEQSRRKVAFWSLIGVTVSVLLCFVVYISFFRTQPLETDTDSGSQVTMYDPSTVFDNLTYRVPEGFSYPEGIQEKYKALYAANQNFVGWLSVPNTSIDCAVYQADDNSFYLKKDLWGRYSRYGTVFMDAYDDITNMKRNTVIYGHNFDDDGDDAGVSDQRAVVAGLFAAAVKKLSPEILCGEKRNACGHQQLPPSGAVVWQTSSAEKDSSVSDRLFLLY